LRVIGDELFATQAGNHISTLKDAKFPSSLTHLYLASRVIVCAVGTSIF
jgi:hypothetical protein